MTGTDDHDEPGHDAAPRRICSIIERLTDPLRPFTWVMIRLVAGLSMVPHGYAMVFQVGLVRTGEGFAKMGYHPGLFWGTVVALTQLVGGTMLAVGLLTRPVCAVIAVFLITAIVHHLPNGYYWNRLGFEYPLFWTVVVLAFAIRGGGRYSVDRLIGREF